MNVVRDVAYTLDMQISEIRSLLTILYKLAETLDCEEWAAMRNTMISALYHVDDQTGRLFKPLSHLTNFRP